MELVDIVSKECVLIIPSTKDAYTLRPLTIEDEIWLVNQYGDKIDEILSAENVNIEEVCKIVYHQIKTKDSFKQITVDTLDENGIPISEKIGGYRLLARKMMGENDKVALLASLFTCLSLSRPSPKESGSTDSSKKKD